MFKKCKLTLWWQSALLSQSPLISAFITCLLLKSSLQGKTLHTELHLLMFYYSLKWTFLKLEKQKKCSTITCAKHLTLRSAWQMFPALLQVFPVIWLKAKPNCMCRSSMTSSSTGCSMSMTSKTDSDHLIIICVSFYPSVSMEPATWASLLLCVHLPAVEDRSIDCVDYNFQVGIISDEISERGTI